MSVSQRLLAALLGHPQTWVDKWITGRSLPAADLSVCGVVRDGQVCGKASTGVPYGSGHFGMCPGHEAELCEVAAMAERMLLDAGFPRRRS